MRFYRDTFHRCKYAADKNDIEQRIDRNRRSPKLRNRIDETLEAAVAAIAVDFTTIASAHILQIEKPQNYSVGFYACLGTFKISSGVFTAVEKQIQHRYKRLERPMQLGIRRIFVRFEFQRDSRSFVIFDIRIFLRGAARQKVGRAKNLQYADWSFEFGVLNF